MNLAIALVLLILISSLVGTVFLTGKSDENYRNDTKKNTYRLTFIYIVVIVLSLAALVLYIRYFAS
jgi:cytochrome c biogenesis protein ResB